MDWLVVWGWICAATGATFAIPQVVRLLKAQTSAGLSLLMWQLGTAAGVGWFLHGLRAGAMNLVIPNLLITLLSVAVLMMIAQDRRLSALQVWPLVAVVVAALAAAEFLTTPALFGITMLVPQVTGMLGQFRDLVRAPDLSGISPSFLIMSFVIQVMWGVWALGVGDAAILICASTLGVIAIVNLAAYSVRRGRLALAPA